MNELRIICIWSSRSEFLKCKSRTFLSHFHLHALNRSYCTFIHMTRWLIQELKTIIATRLEHFGKGKTTLQICKLHNNITQLSIDRKISRLIWQNRPMTQVEIALYIIQKKEQSLNLLQIVSSILEILVCRCSWCWSRLRKKKYRSNIKSLS